MAPVHPDFRLGTVLSTSFTGTLSERHGDPVERIPTPRRLLDWLAEFGLIVDSCTSAQLDRARDLRESIHIAATAAALDAPLPTSAVDMINAVSTKGRPTPILTLTGARHWHLRPTAALDDALSVIAADAIAVASGERDGKLALCASPTCRAAFFDTSRSRTRRWCDMGTCGNREKKARFNASRRTSSAAGD